MGKAMEIISTIRTAGGADAAPVAVTAPSGDVLAIRSFDPASKAWLANIWGTAATEAIARIRSPRFHDNVQGLRFRLPTGIQPRGRLTEYEAQVLYSTDVLIAEIQAAAAETDGFAWVNYYENIGGLDARFEAIEAIGPRIKNLFTVEVACPAGAAVGVYSVNTAINATIDQFKANTDYALLGYECDITGLSVGVVGADTGNVRVGGPMTTEAMETRSWFIDLGSKLGQPCIPIINSQNKASTFVNNCQVVVGLASEIVLIMAELTP